MSNPVFVPALAVGVPLAALPGTAVIAGSVAYQYVEVTEEYTVSDTDRTINCTSGGFYVFLPSAVGIPGREYCIKNTSGDTVKLQADGGETIDGVSEIDLRNDGNPAHVNGIGVLSTGAGWIITSKVFNS